MHYQIVNTTTGTSAGFYGTMTAAKEAAERYAKLAPSSVYIVIECNVVWTTGGDAREAA